MQQSPQTLIHGGRRFHLPRILRQRWRWFALGAAVLLVSLVSLTAFTFLHQPSETASATLQVHSLPTGATVEVDGRARGETPLVLALSEREHEIVLRHPGSADAVYAVMPNAGVTTTLQAGLWRRSPQLERLRPALPGASIQHADFLADGRVVLILSLPPGDERQAWLLGDRGQMERVGLPSIQGGLAVSADGQRVVYLARGDTSKATPVLDEVWIALARDERGERRYRLPPSSISESLVDLSWSRDGQGLLLVSRQRLSGGGTRSLLRWLASGSTDARELVSLPSDIVPGSFVWSPSGESVAFLTQSGSQTALCRLDIETARLRYLADVQDGDTHPFPMSPIAWAPDGEHLLYTAPPQGRGSQGSWLLGGKPQPALFLASPDDPSGRRLSDAEARFPVWRPDGSLLALASGKRGLVLRAFTPGGRARDVGDIPLDVSVYAVRWDPAHAQALLALRPHGSWSPTQTEYWLARWQPQVVR